MIATETPRIAQKVTPVAMVVNAVWSWRMYARTPPENARTSQPPLRYNKVVSKL